MTTPKTVLVIEDDPDILEGLRDLLEDEGYKVDVAKNGKLGLEVLERVTPDVIMLDVMMPVMDGHGFVEALRAEKPAILDSVPILVVTASGDRAPRIVGARREIKKPIDVEALLATLKEWTTSSSDDEEEAPVAAVG